MPVTINLNWPANPAVEAISNYQLWESKDGGAFNLIANPVSNSHSISNPLPGVYSWKIRAVNFVGTGPFGNVAEGPELPTAPGDITVTVIVS